MGMRAGAPPRGVGEHLTRYLTDPLRRASRRVAISTEGKITTAFRICYAMAMAVLFGIYVVAPKEETAPPREILTATQVFNREVGPKELQCDEVRERLHQPKEPCSKAITAFLQTKPPAAVAGPKPPSLILRDDWGGFGGLKYTPIAGGAHRLRGQAEEVPLIGLGRYGGMGIDRLLLTPPAGGKLVFTVTNKGADLRLRVEVNEEKGEWISVGSGEKDPVEIPLTEGMLKRADGMLKKVLVLFETGKDEEVNVHLSALTVKGGG